MRSPVAPTFPPLLYFDYPYKSPRTPHRFSDIFGSPVLGVGYNVPVTPFRSGGAAGYGFEDATATMDVSPILRHSDALKALSGDGRPGTTGDVSPTKRDAGVASGQAHGAANLPLWSRGSRGKALHRTSSACTEDCDSEDEDVPLASLLTSQISAHKAPVLVPTLAASAEDALLPAAQYTDKCNGLSHLHRSKTSPSVREARSRPARATPLKLAWDFDSPLSSPPSSAASSPPASAESSGSQRPPLKRPVYHAPSHTEPVKLEDLFGGVSLGGCFAMERPTRSRTRALTAALLPSRESPVLEPRDAPPANGEIDEVRRSRKRKARGESPPQYEDRAEKRSDKHAKRTRAIRAIVGPMAKRPSRDAEPSQDITTFCRDVAEEPSALAERGDLGCRTFPSSVHVRNMFSLFYRKFPVVENKLRFACLTRLSSTRSDDLSLRKPVVRSWSHTEPA